MQVKISIDGDIWVRLTKDGIRMLRDYYEKLCKNHPDYRKSPEELFAERKGASGYYEFTIRELIKIFGGRDSTPNPFCGDDLLSTEPK